MHQPLQNVLAVWNMFPDYIERFVLSEWIDEWRARLPWFEVTSMLIEKNMMLYNHWIITLVF